MDLLWCSDLRLEFSVPKYYKNDVSLNILLNFLIFCRVEFFSREKWFGEFSSNFFLGKLSFSGSGWTTIFDWLFRPYLSSTFCRCVCNVVTKTEIILFIYFETWLFSTYTRSNSSIFIEYDKIKWFERVHTIFWANAFLFRIHSHFHHSLIGPGPFLIHWIIIPRKLSSFFTIILWNAVEKFLRWFRHRFTSYWNRL